MRLAALAATVLVTTACADARHVQAPSISSDSETPALQDSGTLPELISASVAPPKPAWSDEVDFSALREAYGARADFEDRCNVRAVREEASTALVNERFEEVLSLTAEPLDRCAVWAQLHLWRGAALFSLGREQEREVHKRWFLGLTRSVLDSGDGKTPETPYVTISVLEEDAVLARLGLEKKSQALVSSPAMLDLVTAVDQEGNTTRIYFNPSWHFIRLLHRVGEPE